MNDYRRIPLRPAYAEPLSNPLDALLADIAINVQLPPGLHAKALARFSAVREYLGRSGSPLEGQIVRFYAQGSMAIDATISTRGTDDEFDADAVVELNVAQGVTPSQVLDALYEALKDYPVRKVLRQTRCVTLFYSDGMHIDVTPSRRTGFMEIESNIFHAKPGETQRQHAEIPMNAFGFANWYNLRTPAEETFAKAYEARMHEAYESLAKTDPIVHPMPDQTPLPIKSVTTVALQIIKRFRNVWSIDRPGRYPPSVMLSCHAGHAAAPGMALSDMVIRQARWTARAIDIAEAGGRLLDVRNPEMSTDCFTDRWPENRSQQREFALALHDLANGLEQIRQGGLELEDLKDWLRDRFGPRVVSRSINALNDRNGVALRSCTHRYTSTGGLLVPAAPAIIGATRSMAANVAPRPHTNMGDRWP
ncbi:nucleotidyltransferase [Acidisphaera sp. S103]|uniref:nucleotidyltransferase domain-containing protein n=1 Tax=Acidisphaera sp. S103 TaxID=1747223 RepID=UPI00131B313F|nr:nucleotidyltransferase [Acidisphaera sp. S103]